MTVQVRAVTAPVADGNTTFTVAKPSGTLEGDLMIMAIYNTQIAAALPTPPSDWHQIRGGIGGSKNIAAFYKVAGASEPADYTVTTNLTAGAGMGIVSLYGDGPLTIDAVASASATSSTNRVYPSVTASAAGLLVCIGHLAGNLTSTPPGSATEQWDVTISSSKAYAMTAPISGAGATGTLTATGSSSALKCMSIAVIEAATAYPCPVLRSVSLTNPANETSSVNCTIPADVAAGDLLLLHVSLDADRTVTTPAGWALVESIAASGGLRLYSRTAEAGDAGDTVTTTFSGGSVTIAAAIAAFVSRNGRRLAIGNSAQAVSGSATTITYPDVTATTANALLVCLHTSPDTTGIEQSAEAAFWERYDYGSSGTRQGLCTELLSSAGSTGTRSMTWTSGSHVGNAVSLTIEEINEGILYNGVDLRPWLRTWTLESAVGVGDTTTLASTAKEQLPILPDWNFSGSGNWDQQLDDIFGAAAAANQTATNQLFVEIGQAVVYESNTAFVAQYRPEATIDNVWVFTVRIAISGAPTRSEL